MNWKQMLFGVSVGLCATLAFTYVLSWLTGIAFLIMTYIVAIVLGIVCLILFGSEAFVWVWDKLEVTR